MNVDISSKYSTIEEEYFISRGCLYIEIDSGSHFMWLKSDYFSRVVE